MNEIVMTKDEFEKYKAKMVNYKLCSSIEELVRTIGKAKGYNEQDFKNPRMVNKCINDPSAYQIVVDGKRNYVVYNDILNILPKAIEVKVSSGPVRTTKIKYKDKN